MHGMGWRRAENLAESQVKVISDCYNGETVGQEEKCILF